MIPEKSDLHKHLKNKTEFFDILNENTKDYVGKYRDIIKEAPKIYVLLCKILESDFISKKDRSNISSVIAYFILPKDIFPESIFGAKAYVDDIFLCLYILKELEKKYEIEEMLHYWKWDFNLLRMLLSKGYEEINEELHYILKDMLDYVGIQ